MKEPRNQAAPHTAVIGIEIQVMEKLSNGELTGMPIKQEKKLFKIDANDYWTAVRRMNEFLETVKGEVNKWALE